MLVRHIVSVSGADVATTRPDATIADAAKLLKERNVGALVITTEDGRLAGILSERDLVRGLPDHGADLLALKVKDRMTAEVTTCTLDDRVDAIMKLMTDGRFRHRRIVPNAVTRTAGLHLDIRLRQQLSNIGHGLVHRSGIATNRQAGGTHLRRFRSEANGPPDVLDVQPIALERAQAVGRRRARVGGHRRRAGRKTAAFSGLLLTGEG